MLKTFLFRRGVPMAFLLLASACVAAQAYSPEPRRGGHRHAQRMQMENAQRMQMEPAQQDIAPIQARASTAGLTTMTLVAGGVERMYYLHVPPTLDPSRPAPLVLAFHGGGGDAASFADRTRLSQMADRNGYIIAYPQGIKNSWNTQGEPAVGFASRNGIDDVGFARAMIGQISASYPVDPSRIFAVGMSAGGMMAYSLACDMPDQISAIAVVAGTMTDSTCAGVAGISLLHIHGTNDQNVPMMGGSGTMSARRASYPPVMAGVSLFEQRNQCSSAGATSNPASDTTCDTRACAAGETVTLCTVAQGGHAWPGTEPAPWQVENGVYVSPNFDATGQIEAFLRSR